MNASTLFLISVFSASSFIAEANPALKATEKKVEHRSHGAHEHGAGKLNVAIEKNMVEIEIDAPANNFVGFEYAPKSASEKKIAAEAYQTLKDPKNVVSLPPGANCTLHEMKVSEGTVFGELVKLENSNDKKEEAGHSDIGITYTLECAQPNQLKGAKVVLMGHFKNIKKLIVQSIIDGSQRSSTLSTDGEAVPGL
jgi:hypothetical protein